MIAFRLMMSANHNQNSSRTYNFNFTDATYTPPTGALLTDFDPFDKPNFNFKLAGHIPPAGNAVNFNFI